MPRTRGLIIDVTQSKIVTNVANTSSANSSTTIAASVLKSIVIPQGTSTALAKVAQNVGSGFKPASNAQIVSVKVMVTSAPKGKPIIVLIKKGTTYTNATTVATITLAVSALVQQTTVSINLTAPNDTLYYDVSQVGSSATGIGLSVTYNYYLG
jgi:hypothetical protein